MNKTRISFLSLSLAVVLSGVMHAQESPVQITWVTQESKTLGFTMDSPKDWKVQEGGVLIVFMHHDKPKNVSVFLSARLLGSDFERETLVSDNGLNTVMKPRYKKTKRTIDGHSAIQVDGIYESIPNGHLRHIYLKENGRNLELTCSVADAAVWEEYLRIFERMLSSIKFSGQGS